MNATRPTRARDDATPLPPLFPYAKAERAAARAEEGDGYGGGGGGEPPRSARGVDPERERHGGEPPRGGQ